MNKIPNPKTANQKGESFIEAFAFLLTPNTRSKILYGAIVNRDGGSVKAHGGSVIAAHAIVGYDGDLVIAAYAIVNYDGGFVIRAFVGVNAARRNVIRLDVKGIRRSTEVIYILNYLRLNFAKYSLISDRSSMPMPSKILTKSYQQMFRKGQMLIAQRFIVGLNMERSPQSRQGRKTISIENISFVVLNPVLFQKRAKLRLKIQLSVMHCLFIDVINRSVNIADADRKRAVTFLPFKPAIFGKRFVNPFRRSALDQLHRLRNGNRRGHRNQ